MTDPNRAIARFLRDAVDSGRCLQKDLAEAAGVTEQAVSKWMRTGNLSLASLIAIADRLNATLDEMVGRKHPPCEDIAAVVRTMQAMEPAQQYKCRQIVQLVGADPPALVNKPKGDR